MPVIGIGLGLHKRALFGGEAPPLGDWLLEAGIWDFSKNWNLTLGNTFSW